MKCLRCIYYNLRPSSNYNLSYCLKFNTFCEVAVHPKKCGPQYKEFIEKPIYTKHSVNF